MSGIASEIHSPIPKTSLVDLPKVKAIYAKALVKGTAQTGTAIAVSGG